MIVVFMIIVIMFLVYINIHLKDYYNTANLFSMVWGSMILFNFYGLNGVMRVSNQTLALLFLVWLVFIVGYYLMGNQSLIQYKPKYDHQKGKLIMYFLVIMQGVVVLYEIISLQLFSNIDISSITYLRVLYITSDLDLPIYITLFKNSFIYYIPLVFILYKSKKINKNTVIFIIIFTAIITLIRFTRAPFLSLIVISFYSYSSIFKINKKQIRSISLIILLSVFLFIIMQLSISTISSNNNHINVVEVVSPYLIAPLKAYEQILMRNYPKDVSGLYSLDFINYILSRIGLIHNYPSLIREYSSLYIPTNVYTFLDSYTLDFGVLGMILAVFILSLGLGFIYSIKKRTMSYFSIALYALLSYYVSMIFLNNEFIRFSFLLNIMMLYFISKFIIYRKRRFFI